MGKMGPHREEGVPSPGRGTDADRARPPWRGGEKGKVEGEGEGQEGNRCPEPL